MITVVVAMCLCPPAVGGAQIRSKWGGTLIGALCLRNKGSTNERVRMRGKYDCSVATGKSNWNMESAQ